MTGEMVLRSETTALEQPMGVDDLREQVNHIQRVMREVMQKGEHYGVIPGTEKPTLLKAGAEKLGMTFHLDPAYSWTRVDLPNNHREYEMRCILTHIRSGRTWEGIGACSTMESKYRYRGTEKVFTEKPIPKGYWELKKSDPAKAQELLGGKGFIPGKDENGSWFICRKGERMENPDLADTYNTVLKMAKKRAHVDAIITATAASDIFTQDVEDLAMAVPAVVIVEPERMATPPVAPKPEPPAPKSEKPTVLAGATGTWIGKLASVTEASGTTNGKQWTRYVIEGSGKEAFVTFSQTAALAANGAIDDLQMVQIEWKRSKSGGMDLTDIFPASDTDVPF